MPNRMTFVASVDVDVDDLTEEQIERLKHHAGIISRQVYEASIASMVKGVKKYGPEPRIDAATNSAVEWGKDVLARNNINGVVGHWFPHIFSEAVDCANQTGLFADALGVDVLPEGRDV